jgi:adenine-specific DNA glycosylase
MQIHEKLEAWYEKEKRDLPWRNSSDPYKIWLSEIILQQTRVAQGTGYYHRFLEKFPDIFSLAGAETEEVLKTWQGLGYYSRARNLHATAHFIAYEKNGQFPSTCNELRKLKGIGGDIWEGLYEFPLLVTPEMTDLQELQSLIARFLNTDIARIHINKISDTVTHKLSHRNIITRFIHISLPGNAVYANLTGNCVNIKDFDSFPVPKLIERYILANGF